MPSDSAARCPNADLIGVAGSRSSLVTPCLVLDLDLLEANIARMAAHCRAAGLVLRPHGKTHKSVRIARLQLQAGAAGICCATIGEAEIMVAAGIPGVLITSPVVPAKNIERLVQLQSSASDLMIVADNPENVLAIAERAKAQGTIVRTLVDVDVGTARTGVSTIGDAVALACLIRDTPGVELAGLQAYAGHLQHIEAFPSRSDLASVQTCKVADILAALRREGIDVPIVSGGGTGTHVIDSRGGVFTELQAGSYAVMDVEYADVELLENGRSPFAPALFVRTTVISSNARGFVTTDAGLKRFATDGPKPRIASGAPAGATYAFSGDEHGCIVFENSSQTLPIGSTAECIVPHCDPTVNLYDHYHCVRGDTLVDLWPVDARGAY